MALMVPLAPSGRRPATARPLAPVVAVAVAQVQEVLAVLAVCMAALVVVPQPALAVTLAVKALLS